MPAQDRLPRGLFDQEPLKGSPHNTIPFLYNSAGTKVLDTWRPGVSRRRLPRREVIAYLIWPRISPEGDTVECTFA